MRKRELDLRVVELGHVLSFAIAGIDLLDANDLNASVASAVSRGHLVVKLINGTDERRVTKLLVHIVRSASAVVSNPHAEVFHVGSFALVDLVHGQNLSGRLLQLTDLVKKVPETGLGRDRVRSKHSHAEDLRIRLLLRRRLASDDLIIL